MPWTGTALNALEYPLRFLFADDIFISYSRIDGISYAEGLASELARRRFSCRVDLWETVPGGQIPSSLKRALRWSKTLVLIGTSRALESPHVRWEIQEFLSTSGIVIPIAFDSAMQDPMWFPEVRGLPITSETDPAALLTGKPSLAVLSRIENSAKFRRRNKRIRDLGAAALGIFLVLMGLSVYAGWDARRAIKTAAEQEARAAAASVAADQATANQVSAEKSASEAQKIADRARRVADLEERGTARLRQFRSGQGELESLSSAIQDGQTLLNLMDRPGSFADYPTMSPVFTLNEILSNIHEKNRFRPGGSESNFMALSQAGRQLALIRSDDRFVNGKGSLWVWDVAGKPLWHCAMADTAVNELDFDQPQKGIVVTTQMHGRQHWDRSCKPTALSEEAAVNIDRVHGLFAEKGPDGSVRITNRAGATIANVPLGLHQVKDIRANSTGTGVLAFVSGQLIEIWRDNRWVKFLAAGDQPIQDFQFTGNGEYVVVEFHEGGIQVLSLSGEVAEQWKTTDGMHPLWMSPDGMRFATSGRTVQIWNVDGSLQAQFPFEGSISDLRFMADGSHLAIVAFDTVRFVDFQGAPQFQLAGHVGAIRHFFLLPGEQAAITAGVDGTVRMWDLSDRVSRPLVVSKGRRIHDLSFLSDGKGICAVSDEGAVTFWDSRDRQTGHWTASQRTDRARISPDRNRIALFFEKGFELRNRDGAVVSSPQTANMTSVLQSAFSPDGKMLATSHAGGMIEIQSLATGASVSKPTPRWVYGLAFDQTGATLAATAGRTLLFFDTRGNLLRQVDSGQELLDITFSQDGRYMATAGADGSVSLRTPSGQLIRNIFGNSARVLTVSFSPDSQMVATASEDQTVRIWDLQGREIASYRAPVSSVTGEVSGGGFIGPPLKFSPDGHVVALGDREGVVHLFPVDQLNSLIDRGTEWLAAYHAESSKAAARIPEARRAGLDAARETTAAATRRPQLPGR
jgi:WD40 repeat protein